MAGKFLPLDHDDDEEDSLLDASVRVERFERKVMGRAWAREIRRARIERQIFAHHRPALTAE